jgi:pyrroloquinoline quinone (PQQ) biosynthesis protein C
MVVATNKLDRALPGDAFLDLLEEIRGEVLGGEMLRKPISGLTPEQIAAQKRKKHLGGDANHRFEGERYLNCTDKGIRRMQLRKLVDEGGQTSVGGPTPSHPTLDRWHSMEFGLTEEEIDRLEKSDAPADQLIVLGWWVHIQRNSPWQVALGTAMAGEGEKRVPGRTERFIQELEDLKREYATMGVNVERAIALKVEHAPIGVDLEHAEFGANIVKEHVNTAELQDEVRKAFIMSLQGRGSRSF